MSVFTLAISHLTASNLPWFMDLTFQVPMQYCSLQHPLLLPPDTPTTECHFHFGPAASFFLELWVIAFHCSPVAYWTPSDLGRWGVRLLVSYLLYFHTVHGVSQQEYCFAIPSSSGPHFVRTLHYDPSVLGALHGMAIAWVTQAPSPGQGCDPWRNHWCIKYV